MHTTRLPALPLPPRRICRRIYPGWCVLQRNRVQITAARTNTAMHVIMNAGRLFVSVPSAGNIGHFEFSIFNALVSPFGPHLPRRAPPPSSLSSLPRYPFLSSSSSDEKERRTHSGILRRASLSSNFFEEFSTTYLTNECL